jgi:hypothetical protein
LSFQWKPCLRSVAALDLLSEDGETVGNLINSEEIDFLWFQVGHGDKKQLRLSELTLEAMTANGCHFTIKAVDDGADGVTFA